MLFYQVILNSLFIQIQLKKSHTHPKQYTRTIYLYSYLLQLGLNILNDPSDS